MDDYELQAISRDRESVSIVSQCLARNGSRRDPALLQWLYLGNPLGNLYADVALKGDEAAAIYVTISNQAWVEGRIQHIAQSLDTLTDEAHRGQGLHARLGTAVHRRAANDGIKCVYGFPNMNSAPGYFNKLHWKNLDPVPFLIRPLRTRYVAKRLGTAHRAIPNVPVPIISMSSHKNMTLRLVGRFRPRHDQVWQAFAEGVGVAVDRSHEYLNWRFVDKPGVHYERLEVLEGGETLGFAVLRVVEKHAGRIGYLMELITLPSRRDAAATLLNACLRRMRKQGADVALAWCFRHSSNFPAFRKTGFVSLPERMRPIEMHFGALAFDPDMSDLFEDRESWYLSYADSDTV